MHELVVISSIKWAIRWSERGFPRDPLQAAERQFLIYVRFPNQHKTPFSQVSCHKYKQLQFQMRPDSINFAANFRFGTAFPPFPTNYPQRVGQRELWRRVRSPDLMRWFLGLIVLLCVTRYLIEMWNAFAQVHQGHSVRMNRSLYSDLLVISRQLFYSELVTIGRQSVELQPIKMSIEMWRGGGVEIN